MRTNIKTDREEKKEQSLQRTLCSRTRVLGTLPLLWLSSKVQHRRGPQVCGGRKGGVNIISSSDETNGTFMLSSCRRRGVFTGASGRWASPPPPRSPGSSLPAATSWSSPGSAGSLPPRPARTSPQSAPGGRERHERQNEYMNTHFNVLTGSLSVATHLDIWLQTLYVMHGSSVGYSYIMMRCFKELPTHSHWIQQFWSSTE